jgi:hypothetical protein
VSARASRCIVCLRSIEGASLADPETGDELHAECLADRVLHDAILAALGLVALFVAPTVVVLAG